MSPAIDRSSMSDAVLYIRTIALRPNVTWYLFTPRRLHTVPVQQGAIIHADRPRMVMAADALMALMACHS